MKRQIKLKVARWKHCTVKYWTTFRRCRYDVHWTSTLLSNNQI